MSTEETRLREYLTLIREELRWIHTFPRQAETRIKALIELALSRTGEPDAAALNEAVLRVTSTDERHCDESSSFSKAYAMMLEEQAKNHDYRKP